jgi:hypothetical protein
MNKFANATDTHPVYKASTKKLVEPFVSEMEGVFKRLEALLPKVNVLQPQTGPSADTVNWAKQVLLRVLPRKFLVGAEINAFESEIHATWDNDEKGKRVVVFFPESRELKIYHELVKNNAVTEHKLVNATSACDVADRLRWFFQ